MLDMFYYFSMLMFGEVAPTRRTRGVMALSTTYKHPKGEMHNKKCIFFKKKSRRVCKARNYNA